MDKLAFDYFPHKLDAGNGSPGRALVPQTWEGEFG